MGVWGPAAGRRPPASSFAIQDNKASKDNGLLLPHFEVTDVSGAVVRYGGIWQRANIALVCLAGADPAAAERYRASLEEERDAVTATETRLVVTGDPIAGLPAPSVVIGDRWGEVHHLAIADSSLAALPPPAEVLEWLHYVRMRCPECEGEWR
jgi:hypothetical protein